MDGNLYSVLEETRALERRTEKFADAVNTAFRERDEHLERIVSFMDRLAAKLQEQDKKIKELEDTIIDMTLTGTHETDSK